MNDQDNLQVQSGYNALRDQNDLLVSLQSNKVAIIAPTAGQTDFPVGGNYQWTKLLDYDYYQVQTSSSDTFDPLIEDTVVKAEQLASTLSAGAGYWIRVKAKEIKDQTVNPAEITGVSISPSTATVTEGETLTLSGSVQGTGNYTQTGTWTRSNGAVPFSISGNDITFNPSDGSAGAQSEFVFTSDGDNSFTASRTITVTEAGSLPSFTDTLEGDFQSLQQIYTDTDGDNWTNNTGWAGMTAQTMGDAFGVTTNAQGRVTELVMPDNNLVNYQLDGSGNPVLDGNGRYQLISGRELKDSIGNLQQLKVLVIQKNRLTGDIPNGFYNLTNLEVAALGFNGSNVQNERWPYPAKNDYIGNKFTGGISPLIGNMVSLKKLFLDRNYFYGLTLPTEIGNLTNLEYLVLNKNAFIGQIPSSIGNLTKLEVLHLSGGNPESLKDEFTTADNSFSGEIPSELGNLTNLRALRIPRNTFTGGFPLSFSGLSSLSSFIASASNIEGDFPNHINNDNSPNMTTFYISENNISGTIDPNWNGGNLDVFTILRNNITGALPLCFTDSNNANFNTKLKIIETQDNNFNSGGFADTLQSWYRPRRITIQNNSLSGNLPTVFPVHVSINDEQLEALNLSNNNFSGSIPLGFGQMNSAEDFAAILSNNNLSGYESGAISPLVLDSSDNYVSGIRGMKEFNVSGNDLPQSALDEIILDMWANVQSRVGTQWENWGTGRLNVSGQSTGDTPSNTTEINNAISGLEGAGWIVTT